MSTLALMVQRIQTLTNRHISEADIKELINRVHQSEVESREWHYRKQRVHMVSGALKSEGTVSVDHDSTLVLGTGTSFDVDDVGRYIRFNADDMAIPIRDIQVFPDALGFFSYDVDTSTAVAIQTSFNGAGATQAVFTVLGGNLRYTYDGTEPEPGVGHLMLAGNEFTLEGHSNLDRFKMIAENTLVQVSVTLLRQTEEVYLSVPWPGPSFVDATYELFTRFYTMPANCDTILNITHAERPLVKLTKEEFDLLDCSRKTRNDKAYRWADAGTSAAGRRLIELWPTTTDRRLYEIEYLAGHTTLESATDRPMCPSTLLENRALSEACLTAFAKTGDDRWTTLAQLYEQKYYVELEDIKAADAQRYGVLERVLDLDGIGYGGYIGYDYRVTHDGGY